MIQPLDGPSIQYLLIGVTNSTVIKIVKPTFSELEERKVVTIQPLNSSIRVFFANDSTIPSVSTVSTDGFVHFKKAKETYEASASQTIYILSENSNTDVVVAERA